MALGNGRWYKYSQLQRFIHSLQSQPSLQWAQWQLNGVTHHEGNTRKTFAMSYELPRHLITKLHLLETKSSDDLSCLVVVGGWINLIKTLLQGLLTTLTQMLRGVERLEKFESNPSSQWVIWCCDNVQSEATPTAQMDPAAQNSLLGNEIRHIEGEAVIDIVLLSP